MLLHTGALRYKYFLRRDHLLRETFRCRGGYTQLPLRRDACTQVLWHANTCTQCFYGHILLRRDSSTRIACKHFYIENFWHTVAGAFTCKYFYTAKLILCMFLFTYMHALSQGYFRSYMLSITHAFIQRCFYTETPLHRDAFVQGCFHAQKWFFAHILLQRDDFTLSNFKHKCQNKQSHFYKRNVLARGIFTYGYFYTDILLHDFRRRTRIWRKRTQQGYAKSHFHHSFWRSRRISWDRVGLAQAHVHIAIWPQCMMVDISRKRVVFHGH